MLYICVTLYKDLQLRNKWVLGGLRVTDRVGKVESLETLPNTSGSQTRGGLEPLQGGCVEKETVLQWDHTSRKACQHVDILTH